MASEEENSKGFKVQDRRRFSAEGELKPEFSGADESAAVKPEPARPAAGPPPGAGAPTFAGQQGDAPAEQAGPATQPQQAAAAKGYAAARSAAAGSHPSEAGAAMAR